MIGLVATAHAFVKALRGVASDPESRSLLTVVSALR